MASANGNTAANSAAFTTGGEFLNWGKSAGNLFSVNGGIAADQAIDAASCFLAAAHELAEKVAESGPTDMAYGVCHMISMAKALIDALPMSNRAGAPS